MSHLKAKASFKREFPSRPSLEHLKNEAKQRLSAARSAKPGAKLSEIQFQLAREYGFSNWRELKTALDQHSDSHSSNVVGDWIGSLSKEVRVALHVGKADGGRFHVTMDSPDYGSFGFGVQDFEANDRTLTFGLHRANAIFEAEWDDSRQGWTGNWHQNGLTLPLSLSRGEFEPAPILSGLDGTWEGLLEVKSELRLIFDIKTDAHGTFAMCDSPDKNGFNFPASSITKQGQKVTIKMKTASVVGDLSSDGSELRAVFTRGDMATPVSLARRKLGAAPLRRPDPEAVQLDPAEIASYLGAYVVGSSPLVMISADVGDLYAQFKSGPKIQMFASSHEDFYFRAIDAQLKLDIDVTGRVIGLTLHQRGCDTYALRG